MNGSDMDESENLAFVVKRRQQDADTGQTATFTVRVETDRSGPDLALDDWTEDGDTERVYRDYPLELTGTDLEITKQYQITNNGESETNWGFSFSDDIEKYRLVHFMVTRRAQAVGQTSTFVVRVEHDRGWESPRTPTGPPTPCRGSTTRSSLSLSPGTRGQSSEESRSWTTGSSTPRTGCIPRKSSPWGTLTATPSPPARKRSTGRRPGDVH